MKQRLIRWPYLAAGITMMLFIGIIYAWSILKSSLSVEFGWDSVALGLNYTITICFFCLGQILAGIILKKLSPIVPVAIAAILIFAGFFIASLMQGNIMVLYISYGGLCGLGIGIAYNAILSTITSWYPDKRGTISGILMMAFGASSLFLGSIAGKLIILEGWRTTYFILGVSILVILSIGCFFVKNVGANVSLPEPKASKKSKEEVKDFTTTEMLRRSSFWKFYILLILLSSIGTCVISFAKDVSLKAGTTEYLAILLVGVLSVSNGFGRILTGFLFDIIGRKKTMLISNVISIIAPVILLLSVINRSILLNVLGLIFVGLSYGSIPTTSLAYTSSFYGTKNFAMNFSIANTILIPASFSATIAGAMVKASGNYISVFIMLLCFAITGLLINFSIKKA